MQRLNAIFSFIEHGFTVNETCFNVTESTRARQAKEEGLFKELGADVVRLDAKVCSDFGLPNGGYLVFRKRREANY